MADLEIPLFPLHTVLFPGGPLPLRIFEPRYTDMISVCMKSGSGFGISLIRDGRETGPAATTFEIGTLASIQDWHMRHDNMLGITVHGEQRFRILKETTKANQLIMAKVELIENEFETDIPEEFTYLIDVLKEALSQSEHRYSKLDKHFHDATWVGNRLAEVLPLKLAQKQYFLQLDNPLLRLERLADTLEHMELRA